MPDYIRWYCVAMYFVLVCYIALFVFFVLEIDLSVAVLCVCVCVFVNVLSFNKWGKDFGMFEGLE